MNYMCEILEDEKILLKSTLFNQLTYKEIFVREFIFDSCFNQTAFYFSTIIKS
jgi:hypothetical protein